MRSGRWAVSAVVDAADVASADVAVVAAVEVTVAEDVLAQTSSLSATRGGKRVRLPLE